MRIEVRVGRSAFAQALSDLREWIDGHGGEPVKFESAGDPNGDIVVRLQFARPELGFAFRRDWVQAALAEAPAAA